MMVYKFKLQMGIISVLNANDVPMKLYDVSHPKEEKVDFVVGGGSCLSSWIAE